jgi:hypothetical protein
MPKRPRLQNESENGGPKLQKRPKLQNVGENRKLNIEGAKNMKNG